MTKAHPIYKWEIPIQVNKSYVYMTPIQLGKWIKNWVKTDYMGEVTSTSCFGIMYTQAKQWLFSLLTAPTARHGWPKPATTRQNTAQQHGIYFLTSKEEKPGKEGKQLPTPGDGAWRHFRFPFKFPLTDLDNVKELAVLWDQRFSYCCTTLSSSLEVLPTVRCETWCHKRNREPWVLFM